MEEIYLDPVELGTLLSDFRSAAGETAEIRFEPDSAGLRLNSIDNLLLCAEALNDTLEKISALAKLDAESIVQLKADWMGTDSQLADTKFETIAKRAIQNLVKKIYGGTGKTEN